MRPTERVRRLTSARGRGLTLVDCAVAVFVLALVLGAVVTPLHMQIEIRKVEDTKRVLEHAKDALLGFAAAHGYLPCPADNASNGHEAAGSDHTTGNCPVYYGFLPAATLGLHADSLEGYSLDAWGRSENRIRYAIAAQTIGSAANTNAFTRTNGMRTAGIVRLSDTALSLFHVCDSGTGVVAGLSCGAATTLVSTTPAVIWSVGANARTGGVGPDEAQNPNPNGGSADRLFVRRVKGNVSGSEFDDVVEWLPMPVVIARLLAAGQLP